jgi:hypothetical protein
MITLRRSEDRGHAEHGWLVTHHTFSFADYVDRRFMGFGPLRVINQDVIAPGKGFGTHAHADMEIVTYVLSGVLVHRDSMGNGSEIRPGEVQFMSAGSGVTHSEFNGSGTEPVELLQMWILPDRRGMSPRYDQREFPQEERRGRLALAISPDAHDGSLRIGQDAELLLGSFAAGDRASLDLRPGRMAWLHLAQGELRVGDQQLRSGDGAAITDTNSLALEATAAAEFVVWDLPAS